MTLIIDNFLLTLTDDRTSIFRLPFKSKLNLTRFSGRNEHQMPTAQHAATSSSVYPRQDIATIQKNENLKRMIHERLQPRITASMPDLASAQDSPTSYQERSVDEPRTFEVAPQQALVQQSSAHKETTSNEAPVNVNENKVSPEEIFQKRVKFEEVNEIEDTIYEADVENGFSDNSSDNDDRYESSPTPYTVQEPDETEMLPPTPMKRQSRENSLTTIQLKQEREIIEFEPPTVMPRTKRLIDSPCDVGKEDEIMPIVKFETLQAVIDTSTNESIEVDEKSSVRLNQRMISSESSTDDSSDEEYVLASPIEVQVVPKSILKSNDTTSAQKTITFHNIPHAIPYEEETSSSDSSEDEDVWSRVDQHRFHLNRHNDEQSDVPPPLPKTPPPSAEDERKFSFA